MTSNKITGELIQKYLRGTCTLEEKATIILWYNSFDKEDNILATLTQEENDKLKAIMLQRINLRIDAQEQVSPDKFKIKNLVYWLSGVAAAALIFFGVSIYQNSNNNFISNKNIKEAKLLVLENQGATLYERKLEDGTIIWLSPGARIEVPEHFAEKTREVSMTGKVFFEVAKNPKRPFLIYAGGVTTQVLGTSFLINAQKGKDTEVSVVTGKVAVAISDKTDEKVLLFPEQKVVFHASKKSLEKEELEKKSDVQMWKKPKLSFDNLTVNEVIKVLATNFNVTINTNEAIKSCRLKADFSDQNLASVLEMLCKSVDATYEIDNDVIFIKGKGCN